MSKISKNKRVNELVEHSMNDLSALADVTTVVGAPIQTASGYQVIPVSKVTLGYLSGGGDLGETKVIKEGGEHALCRRQRCDRRFETRWVYSRRRKRLQVRACRRRPAR